MTNQIQEKQVFFTSNNLGSLQGALSESLHATIEKVKTSTTYNSLKDSSDNQFQLFLRNYSEIAEAVYSHFNEQDKQDYLVLMYKYNYEIPEMVKNMGVLFRDIVIEINKSEVLISEKKVDGALIENHVKAIKEVLLEALTSLESSIKDESQNAKEITVVKRKISHYKNPWPLYTSQIQEINNQIYDLCLAGNTLANLTKTFQEIQNALLVVGKNNSNLALKLRHDVGLLKQLLQENNNQEFGKFLDSIKSDDSLRGNNLVAFTDEIFSKLSHLEVVKIPIKASKGTLLVRDIELKKTIQKWLDFTVLPEFMDIIGLEEIISNKFQFLISNLNNAFQISENSNSKLDYDALLGNVEYILNLIDEFQSSSDKIIGKINSEIKNEFLVSNIVQDKPFLEIPFQSAINFTGSSIANNVRNTYHKFVSYFVAKFEKSNHQDSFSNFELASKCIVERTKSNNDEHYDLIFLSKNFIGDLFLVPRKLQEQKFFDVFTDWQNGFRKAILVTGDRLSGKTTFLDYTSKKYFKKEVIKIKPNSITTINGRKFKTSGNLKEALSHLNAYSVKSRKPILILDDIELWKDEETSLLENLRVLIHFIENLSDDIFVVVSTNNYLVKQVNNRLKFTSVFSSVIDLSVASKNEILEAVLTRHAASHKLLVSEKNEPFSDSKMESEINKMSNRLKKNIGFLLQTWSYNTVNIENDAVMLKKHQIDFADFFSQEELIILKQLMLFKNITELELRNLTPLNFDSHYKSSLKRLINTTILLRNSRNKLYINPIVLSDIQAIMLKNKLVN